MIRDHDLLENVFTNIENLISQKYKQQQLRYEDFKNLENQINEEISTKSAEIRSVVNQDIRKTDFSSYVFESVGLSLILSSMDQDTEVSTDLQKRIYYETLINLGALILDCKDHMRVTFSGGEYQTYMRFLMREVKSSKLLSVAHDLYYLHKNKGDVDQGDLRSSEIKNKMSLYGSINSEYRLNDIHNKFDIDEIKSYFSENELKKFGDIFQFYNNKVATIHHTQVSTSGDEVYVEVRDNNSNVKKLTIGSIEDIKNIENYSSDEEVLEIKLKAGNGEEYIITREAEKGEEVKVKYYLNIKGYKIKVGNIINNFTDQEKGSIHHRLKQLQEKIELLEEKRAIEDAADIEASDQDYISELRQDLLAQGISESTFNQFEKQLEYVIEEAFKKYVDDVAEKLTQNNIEFNRSKFSLAKVRGAIGSKIFSMLAVSDLQDSVKDLVQPGKDGKNFFEAVFTVNGVLDAMNDVRESVFRNNGVGKLTSKIPKGMRKAFVNIISSPAVEVITFATVLYQFVQNIDAIVKGNDDALKYHLNYYFATSNGIKIVSMSMKPISMATKAISVTSKALKAIPVVSKILGRVSMVTAIVDAAIQAGLEIYQAVEYVEAIAHKIPLSDYEQVELFNERISSFLALSPLYHIIRAIEGRKTPSNTYEDDVKVKDYLDDITKVAKEMLMKKPKRMALPLFYPDQCSTSIEKDYEDSDEGIAGVVQYPLTITEDYSKIIKSKRSIKSSSSECNTELNYTGASYGKIDGMVGNLSSLDISRTQPLILHYLGNRTVYLIKGYAKHLPHITPDEYENGLGFYKCLKICK